MTNIKRYSIDYNKWITQHIPQPLRSDEMLAFITVLCLPLIFCYNTLIAFRTSKLYEISITPQVCYLEKMLNDRYDISLRRIYIEDGQSFDRTYDYLKTELKPDYLYTKAEIAALLAPKTYDYLKGELGAFSFDFVVKVPISLSFDMSEMAGLLTHYKLASKFFTIQTF